MSEGNKNDNGQLFSGIQDCATDSRKELATLDMKRSQFDLSYHDNDDNDDNSVRNHEERHPDIAMNEVAFDSSDLQKTEADDNLLNISSNQSGSNSILEAPRAWISRLSSIVPYTR